MSSTPERTVLPPGAGRVVWACALAGLVLFGAAEVGVRWGGYPLPDWYPRVIRQLDGRPAHVVFAGTSRVFAAIDVQRFARGTRPEIPVDRSFNLGQGYSTIVVHALGIRELARDGLLRGSVVFIEAPGGLPDTSTWHDPWYFSGRRYFMLSVAHRSDLPPFWKSATTFEDKLGISALMALRWSWLATYQEDIRTETLGAAYRMVERFKERAAGGPADRPAALPTAAQLRAGGGVRVDTDDRARIRAEAMAQGRRLAESARLVDDWNTTVVASIVRTVRAGGGTVVFYDMPLSSPMNLESTTEAGAGNRAVFARVADEWGTMRLSTRITFEDRDFPDLWHLSQPASERFTDALVAEWKLRGGG